MSGKKGLITLVYDPGRFLFNRDFLSCEIEVVVSGDRTVVLETKFKRDECGFNAQFLIFDTATKRPLSRSRCGMYLPKAFGKSNSLTIQVTLPLLVLNKEHRVVFGFEEMATVDNPGIELYYVTATSGKTLARYDFLNGSP